MKNLETSQIFQNSKNHISIFFYIGRKEKQNDFEKCSNLSILKKKKKRIFDFYNIFKTFRF